MTESNYIFVEEDMAAQLFEVEAIVDDLLQDGKRFLRIRWRGIHVENNQMKRKKKKRPIG